MPDGIGAISKASYRQERETNPDDEVDQRFHVWPRSSDIVSLCVWFWIDDDGPGIPQELQEDAFRPFHRLEASRSRETDGTGLGLPVARTIIRAHGGDILMANRNQGGLQVDIWLPR